jgi:hypothetical protein
MCCDLLFSMNVGTLQVNCNVLATKLDADTAFEYAVAQMRPQVHQYLDAIEVKKKKKAVFQISTLR